MKRFKVWIQILIEFHFFPQMQVALDLRQSAQLVNYVLHEEVCISCYDVGFGAAVVDSHSAPCRLGVRLHHNTSVKRVSYEDTNGLVIVDCETWTRLTITLCL